MKFSIESLIKCEMMRILATHGNKSGQRLYEFILDSYHDEMAEDAAETPEQFVSICIEAFGKLEAARDPKEEQEHCSHDEFDHDVCLDCGYERDPGEAIDNAESDMER